MGVGMYNSIARRIATNMLATPVNTDNDFENLL